MSYVITSRCVGTKDQSCIEVCPVDCIHDAGEQLIIDPAECVDCDACRPVCPADAIFFEKDVPAEEAGSIAAARQRFGVADPH
ncbi:4Fe-4S binding protein [Actinoplanes sp. N902-109]|uniref:indolepyruvate ferredoxin oxidoreductase subunit alpha n=1 Tax=Actinoplanes sp. (strain N902-109) TaxID=649831 RepID=UPI00032936F4|nr:4Fe-4S binding protein [Actinoplanes sp. N902-109]AGL16608.1 4Fe-4S ferredoxin protein [Actinoplanes sp. N902-109]